MNETIDNAQSPKTRHSKWIFLSNATFQLPSTMVNAVLGGFLLFYYEVVIGLNVWLIVLALTIFTVYNAINDPIIGFLVDRNTRFTRKWGRRFPWIIIGIIPWTLSVYLIFSVPDIDPSANPWPIVGWLLLTLFLFDTFSTLVHINVGSLRPDLFRTEEERRKFAKYYTPIDILAIILGMLLPALFIDFIPGDKKASYQIMGGMIAIVSLLFAFLTLPGNREDKIIIDRYFSPDQEKRMSFFKATKEALKLKSFVVFFIFAICYGIAIALIVTNMLYITTFVLKVSAFTYVIILGFYLLGTFISIPFWLRYIRKINNNKKAFVIAGLAQCAALIPVTFFQGLNDLLIMAFILGVASGGLNTFTSTIIWPSVVDDFVVKTKKSQKGVLLGIWALLIRLVETLDELIFAIVHTITEFENDPYSASAIFGIRLLQGIIPAVVLLVGTLVFWKFFPLSQENILKNKAELERLGL
jgi:GPH family glycoside/pentoside/hexuronide:cation symporter